MGMTSSASPAASVRRVSGLIREYARTCPAPRPRVPSAEERKNLRHRRQSHEPTIASASAIASSPENDDTACSRCHPCTHVTTRGRAARFETCRAWTPTKAHFHARHGEPVLPFRIPSSQRFARRRASSVARQSSSRLAVREPQMRGWQRGAQCNRFAAHSGYRSAARRVVYRAVQLLPLQGLARHPAMFDDGYVAQAYAEMENLHQQQISFTRSCAPPGRKPCASTR